MDERGKITQKGQLWFTVRYEGEESCEVHLERWRVAEMERYHDGSTDIPVEHAEVCAWDIAECDVDENTRKALSTLTISLD